MSLVQPTEQGTFYFCLDGVFYSFSFQKRGEMSKKNEHNCETWLMTLKGCHASRRQKQWAIGDAIAAAKREWKAWHGASARLYDLWQRAAEATGHPEDSLFQYARVAEIFPS